ncbi:nucleolar complex protein 3 homolog [Babylonia areolata]|uniref:nucleolar complex protein 3 homolog n=1 Tax=Babylonia areolata TaxID=304850 RepID=UPI003FD34629
MKKKTQQMKCKKNAKKGSKSKPRSTSSKVANKKLNKFAKQGKLRKQRLKQKKKENKHNKHDAKEPAASKVNGEQFADNDSAEEEDAIQEEDLEFYAGQDSAFTKRLAANVSRKNRKRKSEDEHEDDSSKYEKKARGQISGDSDQRLKMLLPIKDKGKVIPKMMELESEEEEEVQEETSQPQQNEGTAAEVEKEDKPLPQLSVEEMLATRQEKMNNRKQRIAQLATAVIENPEENSPMHQPSVLQKNRKRKSEDEHEDDSSKYEKKARGQISGDSDQRLKMLLPIKDKGKVIPKMMELESEEEEEEVLEETSQPQQNEGTAAEVEKEDKPLPQLSVEEMLATRQEKMNNRKQRIAQLATAVIENPEENISKMKELRKLLGEKDPDVCLTVRKLVMVSMCEIFKDIIPGYRLRLPTAQEKEQKMKQDTKKLMDYESAFLLSYKTYLEYLEHTITGKSFDSSLRLKRLGFCDVPLPQQSKKDLMVIAVQCLCSLLTTHPHFNYRSDVVTLLVPYMNHKNSQVSDTVCQAAKRIFVSDKSGEVTLEVVRAIAKLVKSRKFKVQAKVVETLLCLRIKEVNTEQTEGSKKMKRKEKFQKLSRRERKKLKQTEELEQELKETKATQDKELRLKMHTQIVETMFTMFFNVLKQEEKSPLLPVVLEGLAKFTHLISVDFFHDLYAVFNKLIEFGELTQVEVLHCVQTAFRILSGQGSALNIDPMKFYTHLYSAILGVHAGSSPDDAAIILDTVDAAIIRRKKQVTQQRVLAFIKRLSAMCLHQLPPSSAAYLAIARCMVSMFSYADILYDQEAQGSGVYMPFLQEPEHCHASSAVLWELHAMKKHYHPDVKRLANALLHKSSSSQGDLSQKTPPELYQYVQSQDLFPATVPSRSNRQTKATTSGFRSQDFKEELQQKYPDLVSD